MGVVGPYDLTDWLTLKKLRENLNWYKRHPELGTAGYEKEKKLFIGLVNS